MQHISRRSWLKSGILSVGAVTLAPHIGVSETLRSRAQLNRQGNLIHSPLFKEFLPGKLYEPPVLKAKLNANENPYGPSPMAVKALQGAASKGNRYAWQEMFDLVDKIVAKEGVTRKNIMMGPGSSDLLEKVGMYSFLEGGNIVSADPSYMSMIHVAEAIGADWKAVPLTSDWQHDLDAMEKAIDGDTKLVYICNPNNPTGTITDAAKLREFCKKVSQKVPVFVDEAYLEFLDDSAGKSMVPLVAEGYNIMVARTFSKIHGMAGLRVGYMLASEEYLEEMNKITRGGMGISQTSIAAASASMDDTDYLAMSRSKNAEVRSYIMSSLKDLGYDPLASQTSFVIFPINTDGKTFLENMYQKGVGVRAFEFEEKNWCRVSMGTMDEAKIFINTLETVLG